MKFIKDYGQFIEVGCTSCGKKHTVQRSHYTSVLEGYKFQSQITCSCGLTAIAASRDKSKWSFDPEYTMKRVGSRSTSVKMLLVIGAIIAMFVSETVYIFETDRAAHSGTAQQESDEETSNAEALVYAL
ncbi:hypothetical protein [Paenibacillus harenae]|uniref:Uncharacterized protein n=1 Tax=Paenibacillus harenae TaxID=306543 RepID=A0ABT9U702_PAEHA|nr:hypothetical protein [Paenibacillus harenae]MDQ0115338.1 hypothetical protein [Paenibacillus harenae]